MKELSQRQLANQIERDMELTGRLPPLIPGVRVERFHPLDIALAIENQVDRYPGGRIELHMDCADAIKTAQGFRRLADSWGAT
jgi:hypothetical protein